MLPFSVGEDVGLMKRELPHGSVAINANVLRCLKLGLCVLSALAIGLGIVLSMPKTEDSEASPSRWPAKFIQVPLVRQATPFTCGVAATMSLLAYWCGVHLFVKCNCTRTCG
jgi:hypothetical protein